jgi:hypothetical protein
MTRTCPFLPRQEALPFRDDRTTAWKIVQDTGDVAVSGEGVYFLIGADVFEAAAKDHAVFSSAGAFDIFGTPADPSSSTGRRSAPPAGHTTSPISLPEA